MSISRLAFRRQFIAGPRFIDQYTGWNKIRAGETLFVTAHPDLAVAQSSLNNSTLTILGFVFDPYHPQSDNAAIATQLLHDAVNQDQIIRGTENLGGRWAMLYSNGNKVICFHDPCGLRQVYYSRSGGDCWIGSQPSILIEGAGINREEDPAAVAFMRSPRYEQLERFWPGDGTLYKNIRHLQPNHSLDLSTATAKRFFPDARISRNSIDAVVPEAATLLKGTFAAAARRYELLLPVTAGWDSRVLYAASKEVRDKTFYYIHQLGHLDDHNRDIVIPRNMLQQAGLPFHVVNAREQMDDAFKKTFEKNVTHARSHLAKALGIYQNYKQFDGKLNVTGNGGEIARSYYYYFHHHKKVDAKILARISKYADDPYVVDAFDKVLGDTERAASDSGISVFDLLYWEQRMGNWGSMYPAEQDIAMEEFSPFNNRRLLTLLLSVDRKYRMPPAYLLFRKLTAALWPEALQVPVNPQPLKATLREEIKKVYYRLFY